jgi:hypothetical protein
MKEQAQGEQTPKKANTFKQICKLKRDNVSTRKSWMLLHEGGVTITNQVTGKESTGEVKLTKKEFERFIKFYETGK